MEKLVKNGYIKMIAIDINDFESIIIDERNTNCSCDVDNFRRKYENQPNVKCIYIHMDDNFVLIL